MQGNKFQQVVALGIVTLSVALGGCDGGSASQPSASAGGAAATVAPSGTYESKMPDGTVIRLDFRGGGAVGISMTEDGQTNTFDGQWVENGEVILVDGDEGFSLELSRRGDALVTDNFGLTMTFTKP